MTVVAAKIVCASSPVMKIEPTLEGKNEICISFYSNQNFKIVSYDHKLIVDEVQSNITKPVSRNTWVTTIGANLIYSLSPFMKIEPTLEGK